MLGTLKVTVDIGDPQGQRFEQVEALVVTSTTYTSLPAALLRRLGVSSSATSIFILADGRRIQRDMGDTWMKFNGERHPVPVIFSEDDTASFLGAVALETFGLMVDPVDERLIPVDGLLTTSRG